MEQQGLVEDHTRTDEGQQVLVSTGISRSIADFMSQEITFWSLVLVFLTALTFWATGVWLPWLSAAYLLCSAAPLEYLQQQQSLSPTKAVHDLMDSLVRQPHLLPEIIILMLMWPWILTFNWEMVTTTSLLILVPAFVFANIALTRIKAILNRHWDDVIREKLDSKKENRSVIGDGLALSYYDGYLEKLFTDGDEQNFHERINFYEQDHNCKIKSHKLYIISFASCTNNFTAYNDLEKIGEPLKKVMEKGGVQRDYNNQVYRGTVDGEKFYVICETLSPISTISQLGRIADFTEEDKKHTLRRCVKKLREFLNNDPAVAKYVRIVEVDDVAGSKPLQRILYEHAQRDQLAE